MDDLLSELFDGVALMLSDTDEIGLLPFGPEPDEPAAG